MRRKRKVLPRFRFCRKARNGFWIPSLIRPPSCSYHLGRENLGVRGGLAPIFKFQSPASKQRSRVLTLYWVTSQIFGATPVFFPEPKSWTLNQGDHQLGGTAPRSSDVPLLRLITASRAEANLPYVYLNQQQSRIERGVSRLVTPLRVSCLDISNTVK